MSRVNGWVEEYVKFRASLRSQEFMFGKHDCCITACDMIQTITGIDPAVDFRGKYGLDDPMKALRLVKEYGDVDGLAEVVCAKFNWAQCNPNFAQRCDLVCLDVGGGRKALGWLDLDATKILATSMVGLQSVPRGRALRAWRIE